MSHLSVKGSFYIHYLSKFFLSSDICPRKCLAKRGLTEPSQALPEVTLTCSSPNPWEEQSPLAAHVKSFITDLWVIVSQITGKNFKQDKTKSVGLDRVLSFLLIFVKQPSQPILNISSLIKIIFLFRLRDTQLDTVTGLFFFLLFLDHCMFN